MNKRVFCLLLCIVLMGSLTACSKNKSTTDGGVTVADAPLSEILAAVKESYGEAYIPTMTLTAGELESVYGLSEDIYSEATGEVAMISAHVDTFILVKAKSGQADKAEAALTEYRRYLVEESMQYPGNIGKVEGSEVYRLGDYVFFIMLGDISLEIQNQGEEAVLEAAREQNDIAVQAINGVLNK